MAFYAEQDYARNKVDYSDLSDLVDIYHYDMDIDVRSPRDKLAVRMTVKMRALSDGVRVIPFSIGESLSEYDNQRLKRQMRVQSVSSSKKQLAFAQEDWEGGVSVILPEAVSKGQTLDLEIETAGDFLRDAEFVANCFYPISNTTWYPRHGYLDRSTYEMKFLHQKKLKVATIGTRLGETDWPDGKDVTHTTYKMSEPVSLVTFALGPWERHVQQVKFENSEKTIPLEFNSVSGAALPIKESFIIAELNNSVRYFNAMFGAYPYESYSATFHPYGFGQGFPSMLMIPPADRTSKHTFAFISHETAHQWWGNIVAWRSYRDQWLSEGFAEYSGVLYTALRENKAAGKDLIEQMRDSLWLPPKTLTGNASGKLNDVGPIILGHRLSTTRTIGAYQTLIYNKGGLVLRMLHFLFTNPANADDKLFLAMMKDFVEKHRNSTASSDDFRYIANQHFPNTPIAKKYGLKDLNWFFRQWVYGTDVPSYQIEYSIQTNPDGTFLVSGDVIQQNVGEGWFMPIPVAFDFGGGQASVGTIPAHGPKTPFQIKLPMKPSKMEIDPAKWVLAEKVTVKQK